MSKAGSKHGKYVKENVEGAIFVLRHRTISSGTAKQICLELEKSYDIPRSEIKKLF